MAPTCCWSSTTSSSEATSMSKATSVLFGIEDEFDVVSVERLDPGQVQIIIEMRLAEAPCPACGVLTSGVKDRPVRRVRDLPVSGQQTKLWWRKRRLLCVEAFVPAALVHPGKCGDPTPRPGDRAAAGQGRRGDRGREPGRVGGRRRVRGVVADGAQGADCGRRSVAARADTDEAVGDR